jgi:tetratricopeptide (TPR) repeat protein
VRRPIYLFIDQVALQVDKLVPFMRLIKARQIPLVLIGAEREADWTTYCDDLESVQVPQFIRVGTLSSGEVELLLNLLERHNCLGELKYRKRSDQVEAFMGVEHANKQLLVALHVLTRGYPFEKIVLDEYHRVPEKARRLYLDIATMHQFAVPVRAGTISRVSGIRYRDYREEFLEPLKDMVIVEEDKYGDYVYKTRHPNIAALVFSQVCDDDSAKSAQFIRFIEGFDVGYSSDRRTLEGICRGRTLAAQFLNPEEARDIYEAATQAAPNQAYLYQQWAIFETTHPRGDVLKAERLAETAAVMEPGNNPFIHTQAEVARKRANVETSAVLKHQLRRQARMFLNKLPRNDRFTVSSRCKLLVDEIADLSDELRDDERGSDDSFFAEKLRDTETMLMKAQQAFPDDAEMFEIEARLWSEMKDKTKALRALERAWRKMPRGSGTAIRIGKIYATAGRRPDELKVLTEALDRNPEDKAAHYAMAIHLLGDDPINNASVIYHLGSSFQTSDANFEARFTFAQFLFATGDVDRAVALFSDIDKRAPKEFRRFAPRVDSLITAPLPTYRGTVESTRDNNIFIRSAAYPNRIFAHRSALDDEEADEMEVGQQVFFRLRFNRVGPVAVSVSLKAFIERRNAMTFESQTAVINREASRQTA